MKNYLILVMPLVVLLYITSYLKTEKNKASSMHNVFDRSFNTILKRLKKQK